MCDTFSLQMEGHQNDHCEAMVIYTLLYSFQF